MNVRRVIALVALAIATGLFEATFVTLLPPPWRDVRPILEACVLLVVLGKTRAAIVFAGVAGFMLDVFRVDGPSFAFGRFILVVAVVALLAETLLTNRSVYATAALILTARFLDRAWSAAHTALVNILLADGTRMDPTRSFLTTVAWDIGIVSACFVVLAVFTRRFLVTVPRATRDYDDV